MKNMKRLAAIIASLVLIASLSACSSLDVVQKDSVRAFGDVMNRMGNAELGDGGWQLQAPDGMAKLSWTGGNIQLTVDAAPFIGAGLDLSKLDNADESTIGFTQEFEAIGEAGETALGDFAQLMAAGRNKLEYHLDMDHFNFLMGDAMVMWAKDLSTNGTTGSEQKHDIMFILSPEPLIEAGVNPDNVEGWTFTKLTLHEKGKTVIVDKLTKPFNLD